MANLQDLLAQKADLDRQIENARKQERADAIAKIRTLMTEYGLNVSDLGSRPAAKSGGSGSGKVAVKFRDPATGDSWTGRGLQPKWLRAAVAAGRKVEEFRVT